VNRLRCHILSRRRWAIGLVTLALLAKLLVPAGFMPLFGTGTIMVELCSGYGVEKVAIALPAGKARSLPDGEHGKADSPCTFSALSATSLAGADPIILAIAIGFILATVFRAVSLGFEQPAAHLRPPLRGPPPIA